MRRPFLFALCTLALVACDTKRASDTANPDRANPDQADSPNSAKAGSSRRPGSKAGETADSAAGGEAVAYFAGGCFWGVEHFMEEIDGVASVESGYMGGDSAPTYETVSSGKSGHYETVRVRYDPTKVDYPVLARTFFEIHDPTQADGQGPDIGSQYRSVIFVRSGEERTVVDGLMKKLQARGYTVVTEVKKANTFYAAEDYHQDHYKKNGQTPYCHGRVDRFGRDAK